MAKGHQRSNRELKKPKAAKPGTAAAPASGRQPPPAMPPSQKGKPSAT